MILLAPVPLKLWHYQSVHPPCLLEVMALSAMSGIWVTWPIEKISALTQVSSAPPHIAHSTSPHMDNVIHAMWCGMSNTKQSRRNPRESRDLPSIGWVWSSSFCEHHATSGCCSVWRGYRLSHMATLCHNVSTTSDCTKLCDLILFYGNFSHPTNIRLYP